ncbi:unnamed protein product [Brassica oleracea var. botrytis]
MALLPLGNKGPRKPLDVTRYHIQFCEVIYEIDSRDPVEALQEEEPRPSLNAHIQNIQLMLLKIGDHKVAFQAREENRVADKIAKEDLF